MINIRSIRHASQEINPILLRLNKNTYETPRAVELRRPQRYQFDKFPARTWSHQCFTPATPTSFASARSGNTQFKRDSSALMYYADVSIAGQHTSPFALQFVRMKAYLDGYFHDKALVAQPQLMRTVAGCHVYLMVYNPSSKRFDYAAMEETLSRILSQFQSAGTSGHLNDAENRVKVKLDVVELSSPLLNADILAQYVGRLLERNKSAPRIFDSLTKLVPEALPRSAASPATGSRHLNFDKVSSHSSHMPVYSGLPVLGFRVRIKGRPKGEEMASKSDVLHGSCPKTDSSALMDYGKWEGKLRSGMVGVKAWVHFQRPHHIDESGYNSKSFIDDFNDDDEEDGSQNIATSVPDGRSLPLQLMASDRDYDPEDVQKLYSIPAVSTGSTSLWSTQKASDNESVAAMVSKLNQLHLPKNPNFSRFIW